MSPAPAVNKGLLYDGSRRVDVDPKFDNTDIRLGATARAPYGPENTWARPNGDREDYNKKTDGLTAMQKVSSTSHSHFWKDFRGSKCRLGARDGDLG